MDSSIFLILLQDGVINGAVYALLALSLVLVFTITRVIFIPQGEFVAYGALTLASIEAGQLPATAGFLMALGALAAAVSLWSDRFILNRRGVTLLLAETIALPLTILALSAWLVPAKPVASIAIVLALLIVTPMGLFLHRIVYRPLSEAPVLTLLIASVGLHLVLSGLGLAFFGAEGYRTSALSDRSFVAGPFILTGQSICIVMLTAALMGCLFLFFERTLAGKALRATAVNRLGAQLVGISPAKSGRIAFTLAAFIGALSGILIAPVTTIYYDTGFLIGLKGFVAAIIAGLASYPAAVAAAIFVGIVEAFASFWASTFKEVIVFTIIIPVLLWRSWRTTAVEAEDGGSGNSLPGAGHRSTSAFIMAGALVAAIAFPELPGIPPFWITLWDYIGLSAIVVIGLVVLTGVAGITSFGQAVFAGFGAYAAAVLATRYGVSPWVTLAAAVAITGVTAWAIGAMTLRLSGHYLAVSTIALNISFYYLFANLDFFGRNDGIQGIPPLAFGDHAMTGSRDMGVLIWGCVALFVILTRSLLNSRTGRTIRSLKGGALAAESFGIDTAHAKNVTFVYAAVLAAVSGWLYAHLQRAVNPTPFNLEASIEYLLMVVAGGAGSVWGAIAGSVLVTLLKDQLQNVLPLLFGSLVTLDIAVFGAILIVILQTAREGLWPPIASWFGFGGSRHPAPSFGKQLSAPSFPAVDGLLLEARGLQKAFGGLVAVDDFSISIDAGEIVGLIGPNGAGKSTTFAMLSGAAVPSAGEIYLRGKRVDGLPARAIARLGIARTFQHVKLVAGMSVIENVALGAHLRGNAGAFRGMLALDREEEASLLAEAARQLDRAGLGDVLYMPADTLALGQQRIVEIARALCLGPVLLLLDEPAAGLRYAEKQALSVLLKSLQAEGIAILLVEHDMDFVMGVADRLVVLNFGSKLAEGAPAEVRTNTAVIDAYLGSAA